MPIDKSVTPLVSIVVPAYKSKDTIVPVLHALMNQTTDIPYEVTVVESSGDGAAQIVQEMFPDVRVIATPERMYSGAARNLGAEHSQGELLMFIDSDCLAESTWISMMWQTHQDWDCSVVAGSILNANPQYIASGSCYMNEFSDFFPYGTPRYVRYLPSGNTSYKMDVFRKHHGFDSKEPLYVDLLFNTKLSCSGERLLFNPAIKVAHSHRVTLKEYLGHEFRRGKAAAAARRRGLLIGSSWVKYPILGFLAAPCLYLRKATVFPFRFVRAYPRQFFRMLQTLPCFYLALIIWHTGFLYDIVTRRSQKKSPEKVAGCTNN